MFVMPSVVAQRRDTLLLFRRGDGVARNHLDELGAQLPPVWTSLTWYMSWTRAWSEARTVSLPLGPSKLKPSSALTMASASEPPSLMAWTIIWPATKPSGVKRSAFLPAFSTAAIIFFSTSVPEAPGK